MFSAHPPGLAPPTAQQGPPFLPHNLGPPTSTRVTLETPEGKPLELPPAPSRGKGAAPAPASQPAKIQLSTPDGKPLELPPAPARKPRRVARNQVITSRPAPTANAAAGEWLCPTCQANVFASRTECFKCQTPKPADAP